MKTHLDEKPRVLYSPLDEGGAFPSQDELSRRVLQVRDSGLELDGVLEDILKLLHTNDKISVNRGFEHLIDIGAMARESKVIAQIQERIEHYLTSNDEKIAQGAILAVQDVFKHTGITFTVLTLRAKSDDNLWIRELAISALGVIGAHDSLSVVEDALQNAPSLSGIAKHARCFILLNNTEGDLPFQEYLAESTHARIYDDFINSKFGSARVTFRHRPSSLKFSSTLVESHLTSLGQSGITVENNDAGSLAQQVLLREQVDEIKVGEVCIFRHTTSK